MKQLRLPLGAEPYRVELPIAVITWRDDAGQRHEVISYPHCIDHGWPWWRPQGLWEDA